MSVTADATIGRHCRWCGRFHLNDRCPDVKAIEYFEDGVRVKRVEFFAHSDVQLSAQEAPVHLRSTAGSYG